MPLAQSALVCAEDHGEVGEVGEGKSESLIEQYLLRRVVQVVVSPDDMGYPHGGVIDNDTEVVGGGHIAPQDDEIL